MSTRNCFRPLVGVFVVFAALLGGPSTAFATYGAAFPGGFHYTDGRLGYDQDADLAIGISKRVVNPGDTVSVRYIVHNFGTIIGGEFEHNLADPDAHTPALIPGANLKNRQGPTCHNNEVVAWHHRGAGEVDTGRGYIKWEEFTAGNGDLSDDNSNYTHCVYTVDVVAPLDLAPGVYTSVSTQPKASKTSEWQTPGDRDWGSPQTVTITVPGQGITAHSFIALETYSHMEIPFTFSSEHLQHDVMFDIELRQQAGGAVPGTDYVADPITDVRIPSGTRSNTFRAQVPLASTVNNSNRDGDRCFTVRIHNVRGATLPRRLAMQDVDACILDDETGALPTLTINATADVAESAEYVDIPVQLSEITPRRVRWDFEAVSDTAKEGVHFRRHIGRVTMTANTPGWGVRVWLTDQARQDLYDSPDRTFKVRISNLENAVLPAAAVNDGFVEATVTIRDDDPGELPVLTGPQYGIVKANESDRIIDVPVRLSGFTSRAVGWDFEVVPLDAGQYFTTAEDGVHFHARSGSVSMPAGSIVWGVRIWTPATADDDQLTPKRFLAVRIFNLVNARFEDPYQEEIFVRVSINDNDFGGGNRNRVELPRLSVSTPSPSLRAGEEVVFHINADEPPAANLTVGVEVSEMATSSRLSSVPSQAVLPSGENSVALTLATVDETADEGSSSITLTLAAPSADAAYTLSVDESMMRVGDSASVTLNDGNVPALSLSDGLVSAERNNVDFVVSASFPPPEDLSVDVNVQISDSAAGSQSTSVIIPGRTLSATLSVAVSGGQSVAARFLPSSSYIINPAAAQASATSASATTLGDDGESDVPTVTIAARQPRVAEGGEAVFVVSASEAPAAGLTIELERNRIGRESSTQSEMLVLGAGEADGRFTVAVPEDGVSNAPGDEADSRRPNLLLVTVLDGRGYEQGAPAVAQVNILDAEFTDDLAQELNQSIMPYVSLAIADETSGAVQNRLKIAFAGDHQGLALQGRRFTRFMEDLAATANAGQTGGDAFRAFHSGGLAGFDSGRQHRLNSRFTLPTDVAFSFSAEDEEGAGGGGRFTVWSRGFHHRLDVEQGAALNFDGDVTGGMLGMDVTGLKPGLVLGLGVSHSRSDIAFQQNFGRDVSEVGADASPAVRALAEAHQGEHKTSLTGFHPYFGWQAAEDGSHLWGTLGYAIGDVKITRAGNATRYKEDLEQKFLSLGGYKPMAGSSDGRFRIGVVGDGLYTDMDGDGSGKVDASRIRLGVEMDYGHALADDKQLDGNLKLTGRHDFGDLHDGLGMEMSGKLDFSVPSLGLRMDVQARGLVAHEQDVKEWGVSGGMMWASSGGGRGLALTLRPHLGMTGERSGEFWQAGHSDFGHAAAFSSGYDLELKYGLPVLREREIVSFFARDQLRDDARSLGLGAEFELGSHFSTGYEAVMRHDGQAALERGTDHRAYIRYKKGF